MLKKVEGFFKVIRSSWFPADCAIENEYILKNAKSIYGFWLVIVFYILHQLAMQPSWVLGGEMWAEMATNYFFNANSSSYIEKIFATDAGYVPLPQRLIALVGHLLNLPAISIPYFYTWSAILLTGMMVGAFCLKAFRPLIKSDFFRFTVAVVILMVVDFETRTFINFTYFAAFLVAVITALALVDHSNDVPRWAWVVPILMVSKPAVLAALPAMLMVTTVSNKPRFKWITLVVVILCFAQMIRMTFSLNDGMFSVENNYSLIDKSYSSLKYFFGFLGGYAFGKAIELNKYFSISFGVVVFLICLACFRNKKNSALALVLIGLSLLFFNVVLNSFALSDSWNRDMQRINGTPVYRHIIVGFFGVVLIVAGLFAAIFKEKSIRVGKYTFNNISVSLFLIWFCICGWLVFAGKIGRLPGSPAINNSQWQKMGEVIDSPHTNFCVPIDPLGWIYSRNCRLLNPEMNWGRKYDFSPLPSNGETSWLDIYPPSEFYTNGLISLAVFIKPSAVQKISVSANGIVRLKNGSERYLVGERELGRAGGLLMLTAKDKIAMRDISSIKLTFDSPVDFGFIAESSNESPAVLWMGD